MQQVNHHGRVSAVSCLVLAGAFLGGCGAGGGASTDSGSDEQAVVTPALGAANPFEPGEAVGMPAGSEIPVAVVGDIGSGNPTDGVGSGDPSDSGNSGDLGDLGDLGDSGDSGNSGDSGDSTGSGDSSNSGEMTDNADQLPEFAPDGTPYCD